jgi:hypothetical protein
LSFSALEDPEDSENGSDQAINDELSKYESIVKKLEIQVNLTFSSIILCLNSLVLLYVNNFFHKRL